MIRKWITKIVNEVMEETMNEIQDSVDVDNIEGMAAEKVAERVNVDNMFVRNVYNHLETDPSEIASYVETSDVAYHMDKADIASELSLSDVANELDLDDLASYITDRMSDKIDVNYEEVASNLSMGELACEIDHGMLGEELAQNDALFPDVVRQMLVAHNQEITNLLHGLSLSFTKLAVERREVEE